MHKQGVIDSIPTNMRCTCDPSLHSTAPKKAAGAAPMVQQQQAGTPSSSWSNAFYE